MQAVQGLMFNVQWGEVRISYLPNLKTVLLCLCVKTRAGARSGAKREVSFSDLTLYALCRCVKQDACCSMFNVQCSKERRTFFRFNAVCSVPLCDPRCKLQDASEERSTHFIFTNSQNCAFVPLCENKIGIRIDGISTFQINTYSLSSITYSFAVILFFC